MTSGCFWTSCGPALGQDLSEVQHVDVVAHTDDERDVVLDHQHREVQGLAQLQQPLAELVGLVGTHAGGRLVEQQQIGVGRQHGAISMSFSVP